MITSPLSRYQISNALEQAFISPARILTKSRGKNIHRYASIKMRTIVSVESTLEFDACFHFDFNKEILRFCSQPIRVAYELEGKTRTYVPDFLVQFDCGTFVLYEIKPDKHTESEQFQLEFEAKKNAIKDSLNIDLELVEERSIRVTSLLNNLKKIHRYSSFTNLSDTQETLINHIHTHGSQCIETLMLKTGMPKQTVLPIIYNLISKCILQADLYNPLTEKTKLRLSYA